MSHSHAHSSSSSSSLQPATLKEFNNNVHVLERGHIFFFYRPKVMKEHVQEMNEVQKLLIVLKPHRIVSGGGHAQRLEEEPTRVLIVPKKTLPDMGEKRLAIVSQVDSDVDEIVKKSLSEEHYETFTRGERELGACRLLGEGLYELLEHRENHTHLSYVLEFPKTWEPNSVQAEFGIQREDTLILSAKNPQTYMASSGSSATEGPSVSSRSGGVSSSAFSKKGHKEIPQSVIDLFHGKTFTKINPPSLLSHEGLQLLLIGAVEYDERGVAIVEEDLKREHEKLEWEARVEESHLNPSNPPMSLLEKELHVKPSESEQNENVNMDVMETGEFQ
ncbi:hypothetical protein FDP41_011732 [Naegleria fowleri]|uniref:Uncharacterized protein n=1 Tax=Naegleria fowleri TaxID=5763 RepID=A0A6A5C461_NAEFO|nr:uncharacterized protein FDP41_011732 [Naegleria fowleri]KAF0981871.1 hypothetical protein FDP41_011732 [Naegleria fowleri]